jgi:hypothetical protein
MRKALPPELPVGVRSDRADKSDLNSDLIYHCGASDEAKERLRDIPEVRIYVCPKNGFERDIPGLAVNGQRINRHPVRPVGYVVIKNPAEVLRKFGLDIKIPPTIDQWSETFDPAWLTIQDSYTAPQPSIKKIQKSSKIIFKSIHL